MTGMIANLWAARELAWHGVSAVLRWASDQAMHAAEKCAGWTP